MAKSEDIEFMQDLQAAATRKPRVSANFLLLTIVGFVIWVVFWASQAELDQVTSGAGKVIPSTAVQVVQNLEGGIVSEISVREGSVVKKGQPLLVIDNTRFLARFREDSIKRLGFLAVAARLRAEIEGGVPKYPAVVLEQSPLVAERETHLMRTREREFNASVGALKQQLGQEQQKIIELETKIVQAKKSYALAMEEFRITEPMVARGVMSKLDLVRIRRELNDLQSAILASEKALPRIRSAVREAEQRISEVRASFLSKVIAELNETMANLKALEENLTATKDQLQRTNVVSPVDGIVKQINVKTVGGVIRPGMDLVEIVPQDETLLVEARIQPSDIAFLHPGQAANVRISAYEYVVYGVLEARLERISADTLLDEKGNSYYEIRVRTKQNYMGTPEKPLEIIPGMVAEVDVLTGKRTVLQYLLKPILRARRKALRES